MSEHPASRAIRLCKDITHTKANIAEIHKTEWQKLPAETKRIVITLAKVNTPIAYGRAYQWEAFKQWEREEIRITIQRLRNAATSLDQFGAVAI